LRPGEKLYEELHLNKEDVTTTPNHMIFVAHPLSISQEKVNDDLKLLHEVIDRPVVDDEEIIETLQKVVESYTPNRKGVAIHVQDNETMD